MTFKVVRNDIALMETEAIVNAANPQLRNGGGVTGAIFSKAGAYQLEQYTKRYAPLATGQAVITPGFGLKAKYIIHAVGPIYRGGGHGEAELLRSCYDEALQLAQANGIHSIAFPLISAGIYGYPPEEALTIALSAFQEHLKKHELEIILVLFDRDATRLGKKFFNQIQAYVDDNYVRKQLRQSRRFYGDWLEAAQPLEIPLPPEDEAIKEAIQPEFIQESLTQQLLHLAPTFSQQLLQLIDDSGKSDVEIYKAANIDRKLFSKIRSKADYQPSKKTVFAFCISLQLSLDKTEKLLESAGMTFNFSSRFDVIVHYFILNEIYNIFKVNETLFEFDEPQLS